MLPPAYPKRAGRAIRRCLLIGSIFVGCSADGPGPVQTAVHESDSTWDIIQTEIFAGQCVSCHTAGTSFGRQSGLVLTPDMAYEQLVGAAPTNAAAAADGMMRVSDLGQGMPRPPQELFVGEDQRSRPAALLRRPSLLRGDHAPWKQAADQRRIGLYPHLDRGRRTRDRPRGRPSALGGRVALRGARSSSR